MPTGYTAGILDGEIKTFEQFAKLCMRNFGATIHMRDDSMSAEYAPRTPNGYHIEAIEAANKLLADAKTLSDEDLIFMKRAELLKDKAYQENAIAKQSVNMEKMKSFVNKALEYEAPTLQHRAIRAFMIEQLNSTIRFDFSDYHDKKLVEIELQLKDITPDKIRLEMEARAIKDLAYHKKEYDADLKRCEESNKWVEQFLNSLK